MALWFAIMFLVTQIGATILAVWLTPKKSNRKTIITRNGEN